MALVNIDNILQETCRNLKKLPVNAGIELMSYKRNRTIAIICLGSDSFQLRQKGYIEQTHIVQADDLHKALKKAVKKEFPRSRKVRLFKFSDPEQLERQHQKI